MRLVKITNIYLVVKLIKKITAIKSSVKTENRGIIVIPLKLSPLLLSVKPKYLICNCNERWFKGVNVNAWVRKQNYCLCPMLSEDSKGLRTFSRFRATRVSTTLEVERNYWHAILRCKPRQINVQGVGKLRHFFSRAIKLSIELDISSWANCALKTQIDDEISSVYSWCFRWIFIK